MYKLVQSATLLDHYSNIKLLSFKPNLQRLDNYQQQ